MFIFAIKFLKNRFYVINKILYGSMSSVHYSDNRIFVYIVSSNAALLVTEAVNEAIDTKQPIYVTLLDVSKAFDVVDHTILLDELYDSGIQGKLWLVFKQLYAKPTTSVKWNGYLSENFRVKQGVRQGGVSSAPIYKVYTNRLLDQLLDHHTNHCIGTTKIPAPTCADDMAILSNSPLDTQMALNIVNSYAKNHRYRINASKSATISYNSTVDIELSIDSDHIPYVQEATHLGISRKNDNSLDVSSRIQLARKTIYALMGAGLHGRNGLAPHISSQLWSTYALPRLLYGIEATSFRVADINKMEVFQRKVLRQIQSFPEAPQPASAAVYGLLGAKPIEAAIDTAVLTFFGNICRDKQSPEYEIANRQLAVKNFNSKSWFMKTRKIMNKYDLPSAFDIIKCCPTKIQWKQMVDRAIKKYWNEKIRKEAEYKPSLQYLNTEDFQIGSVHQVWSTISTNPRDVKHAIIKAKILTGTYILQSNRAKFNQYDTSDMCLLCNEDREDIKHFILECPRLEITREYHMRQLLAVLSNSCQEDELVILMENEQILLQLILDSSDWILKKSQGKCVMRYM